MGRLRATTKAGGRRVALWRPKAGASPHGLRLCLAVCAAPSLIPAGPRRTAGHERPLRAARNRPCCGRREKEGLTRRRRYPPLSQTFPKSCPRFGEVLPKLYTSLAHTLAKSCPSFAQVLPTLCQSPAHALPKSCPDFAHVLPIEALFSARLKIF